MKPLQIGVLVLVGAMGGALIMKFSQRQAAGIVPAPIVTPAPVMAPPSAITQPPAVVPQPVAVPPAAAEPAPAAELPPSPLPKKAAATRVDRARPAREALTTVAENRPPDPEPSAIEPINPNPGAPD